MKRVIMVKANNKKLAIHFIVWLATKLSQMTMYLSIIRRAADTSKLSILCMRSSK